MRTTSPHGASAALRRAVLLLPLVVGVLAMHILLLCVEGGGSGADPMAAHAGHGSSVASSAVPAGVHPAAASGASAASAGGIAHVGSHGALVVCVAVLVTAAALVITRPSWRARGPRPARWSHEAPSLTRTHPPPLTAAGLLLCVSRT